MGNSKTKFYLVLWPFLLLGQDKGVFKEEIVGVPVKGRKGLETVEVDEHPRPQTTLEGLQKLKPIFKENGLVTAGSASVIFENKNFN